METVALSSKGQLVVPKAIRESANWREGDALSVRWVDGEVRLRKVAKASASKLDQLAGCLAQPSAPKLSAAQEQAVVRQRALVRYAASAK